MEEERVMIILDQNIENQLTGYLRLKLNERLNLFVDNSLSRDHFRMILIGDRSSGKKRLLERLRTNEYLPPDVLYDDPMPMVMKTILYKHEFVSSLLLAVLRCRPENIPKFFFRRVRGIILCYDISQRSTFDNIDLWIEACKTNNKEEFEIILVGTKSDLPERMVSYEEGLEMANKHQVKLFFETSSKNGENINEMFYESLKLLSKFKEIPFQITNNKKVESPMEINESNNSNNSNNWCNII